MALSASKEGSPRGLNERTAFVAGLWFIGTFIFSIPAALLYDPVLSDANYTFGEGADTRVAVGAFLLRRTTGGQQATSPPPA
jgi:hypothetical protein